MALGLANSYLKRCARKGLIKIQQAPVNRYLYYLTTPQGFAEKSRLTAEYLSWRRIEDCAREHAYLLTDLAQPLITWRALAAHVEPECLHVPRFCASTSATCGHRGRTHNTRRSGRSERTA